MPMAVSSNPLQLSKEFFQDPHSVYQRLRDEGPVHHVIMPNGLPGWLVTSYDVARALLSDSRLSKDYGRSLSLFPEGTAGAYASPLSAHMLNSDPPDHTRLRKLVNKAFTPRAVANLQPRIEQATDGLLNDMHPGSVVDMVSAYAMPLPITIICELLGVPAADRDGFSAWTLAFTSVSTPAKLAEPGRKLTAYLTALIEAKRADPGDDLLSSLLRASDEGSRLSADEILTMTFLLLIAGFETTVNLIANGVLAMLRHPAQMKLLRSDPALLPTAVEEFLRYDGPVHIATVRFTTEPVHLGGTEIPANQLVMISLLAANNDSSHFTDPQWLDFSRPDTGHLAFGHGIHYCVGAPLARLEAQIAIGRLLSRFPVLTLEADTASLHWRNSTLIHGLDSLHVRVG